VAVWFCALVPEYQDWLASLSEVEPDKKYKLAYRFRKTWRFSGSKGGQRQHGYPLAE
jgi:hypothetical protein